MSIKRFNEFPDNSGSLSSDDIFLFMDNPSGNKITKKVSLSELSSIIGGGGGGGTSFQIITVDLHNGGVQNAQVLQFDNTSYQSVITGPTPASGNNSQRIIIQGQRAQGNAEGGDVYLWGGDANANGGDIKIYAGDADNISPDNGYGGYVNIDGGKGATNGGNVEITAGYSEGGTAGYVSIVGGPTSSGSPGDVTIKTNNSTKTWTFGTDGNLNAPGNITLPNYTTVATGTFDNGTGGNNGISLNCYVGYELNWQGGHLKSTQDGGISAANIQCDSPIEFPGSGIDNMEINTNGLIFPDGSEQTTAYIYPKAYGSFYDTTTQTNASTSGSNIITINTTNVSDRISIVDNSKLTVYTSGIFNMQFSAQLEKIDGGDDSIDIWLSKNGEDLDWSNTKISMHAQDAKAAAAWNFMLPLNSGDYIQLKWYSSDADMRILSESGLINPTRPNIPSVILTANQI